MECADKLEEVWKAVMRVGMDLMRQHAPPGSCRKTDQRHLVDTVLERGDKIEISRLLAACGNDTRLEYIARILTDACVVLDILHAQLPDSPPTDAAPLSRMCTGAFGDLLVALRHRRRPLRPLVSREKCRIHQAWQQRAHNTPYRCSRPRPSCSTCWIGEHRRKAEPGSGLHTSHPRMPSMPTSRPGQLHA